MAKAKSQVKKAWQNQRYNSLGLAAAAWILTWVLLLTALRTGNMWIYFSVYVLFIFGLNRIVRAIRG